MKKRRDIQIDDKLIIFTVEQDLEKDQQSSSEWRENLKEWDNILRSKPVENDDQVYNEKLPLIKNAKNSFKSRIMQLLQKRVTFKPTEEGDVDKIENNENFFDWIRTSHLKNVFSFLDHSLSTIMDYGTVISSVTWVKEDKKVTSHEYYPAVMAEQQMDEIGQMVSIERETTVDDIIRDVLPESEVLRITNVQEIGEDHVKITYDEHISDKTGIEQWQERNCDIDFSIDEAHNQIVAIIKKIETEYEGGVLCCENMDSVWFHGDSEDIQSCDHVIKKFRCTVSDLLRKRDQGYYQFSDEDFEKIKRSSVDAQAIENSGVEAEEKIVEGTTIDDLPENSVIVEGLECYYLWDIDGKGYLDQVVFTVMLDAQVVIRKKFLNEVYRHGKRPMQVGVWDIRKQRLLGVGLIENLYYMQKLINDTCNCVLNASAWALNPPGIYDPTASGLTGQLSYKQGELTPVPGQPPIWLEFPANFPVGFQLLSFFIDLLQKDSGISDQIQGSSGSVRTATATIKLIQESYQNMSLPIARIVEWLKEVYRQVWQLYRCYMPDTMRYRVMGTGKTYEFKEIKRSDLLMNPDITLEINVEETSKEYLQQVAQEIFEKIAMNPLLLQAGITTPTKLYNAAKNMLDSYGTKAYSKFIQEPKEIEAQDPEKENNTMIEGQVPDISPMDDDQEHIKVHGALEEAAPRITDPEELPLLLNMVNAHKMLHMQQLQAKAIQQEQLAQRAQMIQQTQQIGNNGKGNKDELQGKVAPPQNPMDNNRFGQMAMPGMGSV